MLGESFLRLLCYQEEKNGASDSMGHTLETSLVTTQTHIQQTDADQQERELRHFHGVREEASGLSIPGCSSVHTPETDMTLCSGPCSLLDHYPDLQVVDSGLISRNTLRASTLQQDLFTDLTRSERAEQKQLLSMSIPSVSDQGYLVMGGGDANTSMGVPASQLEPMSNSLLNGLLEKQLDEVYLQHLTDNLARCHSHLGNSLLHGLVPPLQPSEHQQGSDSLESNLEEAPGERGKKLHCLSNLNLAPFSSNFSTPVLRISEDVHPQ
uniref:uncharacterized protein si:dkey-237j10.2 n=1 Tax=Doryrhamphus excisus TaxID=161450 RepID=UPI0025AE740D|nr:uncharacterized protein si:dkey-237j10.2 [Doryrhamphus excisus]